MIIIMIILSQFVLFKKNIFMLCHMSEWNAIVCFQPVCDGTLNNRNVCDGTLNNRNVLTI